MSALREASDTDGMNEHGKYSHVFEGLSVLNPNVAGIDIGSEIHSVSVPVDRDAKSVRRFGCFTPDLLAMASWLKECGITSVVMESTGVYWVPSYQVLTDAGFDVQLVDAHHAKGMPGRKTDVWDCRWLRKLHTFGLLRSCFIPCDEALELRTYWRHRASLVEGLSQQTLRIHKALEQMNVQIHKVLSDVTGLSGMAMLRAIASGERDPHVLAAMRNYRVKATEETIIKALTGYYRPDQIFALQQALEMRDFIHQQILRCDEQIRQALFKFEDSERPSPPSGTPDKHPASHPSKNEPHFPMVPELKRIFGVDLTRIEGISSLTATTLLAECGPDLQRFATAGHFTSWLAICPNNQITGGRIRRTRTRPGKNRLATALCVAAQSLHHSKTALGSYFRRMRARLGAPKAITATAHKLARLIHMMLTNGEEYVAQGQAAYERKCTERQIGALKRQASLLGLTLLNTETGETVS